MEILSANSNDYLIFRETSKKCDYLGVHTPYSYWLVCTLFGDSCFMIKENNKIAGTIFTVRNKDVIFVWQIGVMEEYRKKGYSQILYNAVLDYARKNGQTKIQMSIDPENQASLNAVISFCRDNNLNYKQVGLVDLDIPSECHKEYELIYQVDVK